jgi:predicted ATP-dependent serine protease
MAGQCNSCKEWNTIAEKLKEERQLGKQIVFKKS